MASEFLLAGVGRPGVWVKLHNNSTLVDYFSTTQTDSHGLYIHNAPGGRYTVYASTSLSLPPTGDQSWTPTGASDFLVPYVAGDAIVGSSFTAVAGNGPYGAFLPGAPAVPTPAGVDVGRLWDYGGREFNVFAFGIKADGVTDDTANWATAIATVPAGSLLAYPPSTPYAALQSGLLSGNVSIISNLTVLKPLTIEGGGWGQTGQTRRFGQASETIAATTTVYSGSRLKAKTGATGYMFNIGQHDPGGTANPYLSYDGAMGGFFMRDLVLDGNARTVDIGAIKMNTVEHGQIDRVRIEHFCREAIKCEEYVREFEFHNIWTFFCGNTTDGQGPAPAYYPCINLFDNSAGADLHNLLVFDSLRLVYSMSDAVLIDTQATVAGSQVRDITLSNSYVHGPVSAVSGFPYTFSALQQGTTTFQIKSCADIRVLNTNVISTGTADSGGTGANNFARIRTGTSAVAPTIISFTQCTFQGRYSFANTPRYGIWLQNGDLRLETCHIDGGDTANVRTEAGTTFYDGLLNVRPAGASIVGAAGLQTTYMQVIWAAQQELKYAGATVSHRISNVDTARTFSFNAASAANGNVPGALGGFYAYDETGGYLLYFIDTTGKFHHGKDLSFGLHLLAAGATGIATANLGANVTSVTPDATSNDSAGNLVIVMAGGLAANTRICRVNFLATFPAAPRAIRVNNETSGAGLAVVNFYTGGRTTGGFDLFSNQALVAGTYTVGYVVLG